VSIAKGSAGPGGSGRPPASGGGVIGVVGVMGAGSESSWGTPARADGLDAQELPRGGSLRKLLAPGEASGWSDSQPRIMGGV